MATFQNGVQFSNLNDLAQAIETTLAQGSAGVSVSFVNGRFVYDNSGGARDLNDLRISRPGSSTAFAEAMGFTGNNLAVGGTSQSDLLLDVAEESDDVANLYNAQGVSLGLTVGGTFSFDAVIGGQAISPAAFTVVNTGDGSNSDRTVQTLGGLVNEMEDVLGLTTTGGVDVVDGAIVVNGRSGLEQELTGLNFSQPGNADLTASMAFTQVQAASDVTHEASIRVFDALGNAHLLTMLFTKDNDVDNRWTWEAWHENGQVISGGTGAVTFHGDGTLESFTTDDGSPLTIDPGTGASGNLAIEFDAGTPGGTDGITGFARESTTAIVDQDGYAMGTLESISVDADGVVNGVFTNGTSRALAQLALATFNNPAGLQRDDGSGWTITPNSGEAVIRRPGTGTQVGSISAGTLEMSNVDIAQEFTNMIVAQRGFQANARTITTSDEMLVELVNLKR
jgi:flagellar hook protein FlgE